MIVENRIIVELKVARSFNESPRSQCLTDLKATGLKLALPLNFSKPRLEIERMANGL